MRLWHIVPVVALVVWGTGCGMTVEDSSSAEQPAAVNTAVAKKNVESAISAALSAKQGEGAQSASSLVGLGANAFSLLAPVGSEKAAQAATRLTAAGAPVRPESGSADCSATSCTFDNYSPDGDYTVDGTMAWADDHIVADLHVSLAQNGMSFDFATTVDLTTTDLSIDGTITSQGSVVVQRAQQYGSSGEFSWEASIEYRALTFVDGQPTGGSVDVSASMTSGDQSFSGDATLSFP